MNVYKNASPYQGRDIPWRLERFMKIAETGIPICIFVDECGQNLLEQCLDIFPDNLKIMRVMSIYDTWVHRICEQYDTIGLPRHRNDAKDIYEYMVLMNSKIEFVYETMQHNPFGTDHFAWIDFNVAHVFKDLEGTQAYLRMLTTCKFPSDKLWIPGCWSALPEAPSQEIIQRSVLDGIHWRFCGGFFLGDRAAISRFHDLYETHFPEFIFRYRQMVWEVNFWSWLEAQTPQEGDAKWKPSWFMGDHDDSIVKIPMEQLAICLQLDAPSYTSQIYDYKVIDLYNPMSACVVELPDGRIGLNTRYVNYTLSPQGYYHYHQPEHIIFTKNIFSILDPDTLVPLSYDEIANPTDIPYKSGVHHGIEDVRLWVDRDCTLRYIGTTVSYSPSGKNRMITGTIVQDPDTASYSMIDNQVLEPPTDTYCEKNWLPLCDRSRMNPMRYIYRWNPLEIGHIGHNNLLVIDYPHHVKSPLFSKLRGSTSFSEYAQDPKYLIGLAHYSEKEWPRSYYHILILLDRKTYRPCRATQPFSFCKRTSIEYCIGLLQRGNRYHFWVSQYDRDPIQVSVDSCDIPFVIDLFA
jgi:Bacterial protein of unknown function (HtrL_YibB)